MQFSHILLYDWCMANAGPQASQEGRFLHELNLSLSSLLTGAGNGFTVLRIRTSMLPMPWTICSVSQVTYSVLHDMCHMVADPTPNSAAAATRRPQVADQPLPLPIL